MVRRVLRPRKTDEENGERTSEPPAAQPTARTPDPAPTSLPTPTPTAAHSTPRAAPVTARPQPRPTPPTPAKAVALPGPGEKLPAKGRSRDEAMARSGVYIEKDMAGKVPKTSPLPEKHEFKPNTAAEMSFGDAAFETFFAEEIENLVNEPAQLFNERIYGWRCQCCDIVIPVPRRTEVFHGAYHIVHDDTLGILVNGERFIPEAEGTRLEVITPGRLRDLRGNPLRTPSIRSS